VIGSVVASTACVGPSCTVAGMAVVGPAASLGGDNHLDHGVRVAADVVIPEGALTFG
jgi:UDP-3-O-[3-hydroxymyristoyl] glucosamine N-acyltransferase